MGEDLILPETPILTKQVRTRAPKADLLPSTPMEMVAIAVQSGNLDMVERLMDLQDRFERSEARKAFSAAFASFKAEAVQIVRTKLITDGPLKGKLHVELGNIVQTVSPALSKHGLSLNWSLTKDEVNWMEVTCILRHADGHFETVAMGGAPDTGPGRNAIQARGSAKTYLERYTATAILGLAPEDEDTDGIPPQNTHVTAPNQSAAPSPSAPLPAEPREDPWDIQSLAAFEAILDRGYTAFKAAKQTVEAYNEFAAKWKAAKKANPPAETLAKLEEVVRKLESAAAKKQEAA